ISFSHLDLHSFPTRRSSDLDSSVEELYSLWKLLKKRMEDKLIHSQSLFVNYSLHDGSHSKSIIHAIERFLGEERIYKLSATDIRSEEHTSELQSRFDLVCRL